MDSSRVKIDEAFSVAKDSIVFFLYLRESVVDESVRDAIDEIIREELKHLSDLGGQLALIRQDVQ